MTYLQIAVLIDFLQFVALVGADKVASYADFVDAANLGLKGSPTNVKKSFTKGAKTAGKVFDVEAKEGAKIILDKLKEQFLI